VSAPLRSRVGLLDRLLVDALGIIGRRSGDVALGGEFPLAMEGLLDVECPMAIAFLSEWWSDSWLRIEALSSVSWSSSGIVLKCGPVSGSQSVFNRPG
jgi:hypothetical protein